ncbi:MAG: dihydropteroate synthase [Candidatus Hatepunaea meridiana]|nr:dihydropteroate synthase [Candidatus Hatepunaea meridiana]
MRDHKLTLGTHTLVMGVVNVTPDSFSDSGEAFKLDAAVERGINLTAAGADILDIGGESTRPGSDPVPLEEELSRVIPVIAALSRKVDIPISVDTYKSEVARRAIDAGASMVNDISAGNFDPEMAGIVAETGVGAVLMHIKGTPRDMQQNPVYNDLLDEVISYLTRAVEKFETGGVSRDRILVDPGIGFGKLLVHNLELIRRIGELHNIACGVLLGTSRKSFIGLLTEKPVQDRLSGTIASIVAGAMFGADMVRVHDVEQVVDALKVVDSISIYA